MPLTLLAVDYTSGVASCELSFTRSVCIESRSHGSHCCVKSRPAETLSSLLCPTGLTRCLYATRRYFGRLPIRCVRPRLLGVRHRRCSAPIRSVDPCGEFAKRTKHVAEERCLRWWGGWVDGLPLHFNSPTAHTNPRVRQHAHDGSAPHDFRMDVKLLVPAQVRALLTTHSYLSLSPNYGLVSTIEAWCVTHQSPHISPLIGKVPHSSPREALWKL